jgi:hypothetical protein
MKKLRMNNEEIIETHKRLRKLIITNEGIPEEHADNLSAGQIAIGLFDFTSTGITLAETFDIVNSVLGTDASWIQ